MSIKSVRKAISVTILTIGVVSFLGSNDSVESSDREVGAISYQNYTRSNDLHKVLGISRAGCDGCHTEEAEAWMKTAHSASTEKLLRFNGNTRKYATALGISPSELMTTSMCGDCHGTKAVVDNRIKVISGVSCESCHGAAGGEHGWFNRHQSYDPGGASTRREETVAHRLERQAACDAAGMIRPSNIAALARKCLSCHIVTDDKLVAAGHRAFSNFEFNSWTSGEIRHNYFLDPQRNQEAPSLWSERSGLTAIHRRRLKLIAGTLASLEVAFRKRAEVTNPNVLPPLGGFAAAMNGKLAQINEAGGTPETRAAAELFAPFRESIFALHPTDRQTYLEAADKMAELTEQFLQQQNVDHLQSLDEVISTTPPRISKHFIDQLRR